MQLNWIELNEINEFNFIKRTAIYFVQMLFEF